MTIFLWIVTVVCAIGAYQERKDFLRCIGFGLFGLLALLFAIGSTVGRVGGS